MIRRRADVGLTPWIERARASLVASFASGVAKDEIAVGRRSLRPGPTARLKVRSRAPSSSDGKCTAAEKSISFKPDKLAQNNRSCTKFASEPFLGRITMRANRGGRVHWSPHRR